MDFNFTSLYVVKVDDFFLHYLQKVNPPIKELFAFQIKFRGRTLYVINNYCLGIGINNGRTAQSSWFVL